MGKDYLHTYIIGLVCLWCPGPEDSESARLLGDNTGHSNVSCNLPVFMGLFQTSAGADISVYDNNHSKNLTTEIDGHLLNLRVLAVVLVADFSAPRPPR